MENQKLLLSKDKARKLLGIGSAKLQALINEGKIKVIALGKRFYISQHEINRFINDNTVDYNQLINSANFRLDLCEPVPNNKFLDNLIQGEE
jgi:hypothetical protein